MALQYLQLRRGPNAAMPTLEPYELAMILDRRTLVLNDGTGNRVLRDLKKWAQGILFEVDDVFFHNNVIYVVTQSHTATADPAFSITKSQGMSHVPNTDAGLDQGGANAITAITLKGHVEDATKHFAIDDASASTSAVYSSTKVATLLSAKVSSSLLGAANGVATLDTDGKVPSSQLPSYVDDVVEYADLAALPVTGESGKIYVTIDTRLAYRWTGTAYLEISQGGVQTVNGYTGTVTLAKSDIGLGNADNTSDANKPVSTATQSALDLKAPLASPTFTGTVSGVSKAMVGLGNVDNTSDTNKPVSTAQQSALDLKAPLASPTFTGTVSGVSKSMVGLGNADNTSDANKPVSTATQSALDLKAPLASPTFTGTVAGVSKSMVGLGNVDNTSDANKPVSSATQSALDLKVDNTLKGAVNGVATLDGAGKVPSSQLPSYVDDVLEYANLAALPATGESAKIYVAIDTGRTYRWSGTVYAEISPSDVITVNGQSGAVVLTKSDVGLANADNTSDANKPVSSATQSALDLKAPLASPTFTGTVSGISKSMVGLSNVDNTTDANKPVSSATQSALDLKAPLASPTFTGTVAGISKSMVGLGNVDNTSDANKPVSSATQSALDLKAPLASPTFTGTVAGITSAMVGLGNVDNVSDANKPVSTAQQTALNLKADLASPAFTGTVTGISKSMVGLGNVDNVSDANKPVSTAQQSALDLKAPLASPTFTGTVSGVSKSMVGLGNVDNTSDANKPVSTAQQSALDLKVNNTEKGAVSGIATLDATGKVPSSQLPSYVDDVLEYANLAALPVTGETAKIYVAMDSGRTYRWSGTVYVEISPSDVITVNGQSGAVVLTKTDLSLGNVSNDAQLKIASNLSDLNNVGTARVNLGVVQTVAHGYAACGGTGVTTDITLTGVLATDTVMLTPKGALNVTVNRDNPQQIIPSVVAGAGKITVYHPTDSAQAFYYQVLR